MYSAFESSHIAVVFYIFAEDDHTRLMNKVEEQEEKGCLISNHIRSHWHWQVRPIDDMVELTFNVVRPDSALLH